MNTKRQCITNKKRRFDNHPSNINESAVIVYFYRSFIIYQFCVTLRNTYSSLQAIEFQIMIRLSFHCFADQMI